MHFAAESHVDRSIRSGAAFVRTNVEGTQALLEACLAAGVERVVHVSTDEVYGSIEEGSWTEESPSCPTPPTPRPRPHPTSSPWPTSARTG